MLLIACSRDSIDAIDSKDDSKDVTFVAQEGDEARYWVYGHHQVQLDGSDRLHTKTTQNLLHYRIESNQQDELAMYIKFGHMQVLVDGQESFNSIDPRYLDKPLQRLLGVGVDVTVNKNTGELLSIRGRDDEVWQEIINNKGDQQLIEGLKKEVNTPGILTSIPAEKGAQVSLPEFNGVSAQITVEWVTKEHIATSIEFSSDEEHLYGQALIKRSNGWLEKMVLITDEKLDIEDENGRLKSVLIITLEDDPFPEFLDASRYLYQDISDSWYEARPLEHEILPVSSLSSSDVFTFSNGFFSSDHGYQGNDYLLHFLHRIPVNSFGQLVYKDIQAKNNNGDQLDIDFVNSLYWESLVTQGNYQLTTSTVVPYGWDKYNQLSHMDSITATADFYPNEVTAHSVTWLPGQAQQFYLGGIELEVLPKPDSNNQYLLRYQESPNHWLMYGYLEGANGEFNSPKTLLGPQWIDGSFAALVAHMEILPKPVTQMTLKIDEQSEPLTLTFYTGKLNKEALFSQPVEFINRKSFMASPKLPPADFYKWSESETQELIDFEQLSSQANTPQGVKITLPRAWQRHCRLQVDSDIKINRNVLVWSTLLEGRNVLFNGSFDSNMVYYLATEDGVQRYFYGLDVSSSLHCDGTPQWKELNYQPNAEYPWLVAIKDIEGLDGDTSVTELFTHYRFYNHLGERLKVINPQGNVVDNNTQEQIMMMAYLDQPDQPLEIDTQEPVSQLLHDGQWLKLGDSVAKVERLIFTGAPIQKRWVDHFPLLPKG